MSAMDKLRSLAEETRSPDLELIGDAVLTYGDVRDVCRRLATIREVYERFTHLDTVLSDTRWMTRAGTQVEESALHPVLLHDCWAAIRTAMEEHADG